MAIPYTHFSAEWPSYRWDYSALDSRLAEIHRRRGVLIAAMATIGFETRQEAMLHVLVDDVTKSSEIEGERIDAQQVRSSIARKLGMAYAGLPTPSRDVEGVVEMMLDATQRYKAPLTDERIFGWHACLFPTGYSGMHKIRFGAWREDADGPMLVVSGPIGRERVHYEAPAASRVPAEIQRFLTWFENHSMDPVLKAAVGHLWFVTIHPLDDGNGRVGRAIMDMALARADQTEQRYYSMTTQIHKEKSTYYEVLEQTQKQSMDITGWLSWFLDRLDASLSSSEEALARVRRKQIFWDAHHEEGFNERQTKIINMLFDGFTGKLHTAKAAKITKCSTDTALRDLSNLVSRGILVRSESNGRSTSYALAD